MSKNLTPDISGQISDKAIGFTFTFNVDSTDYSSYLMNWDLSFDTSFGAANAIFVLNNNSEIFSYGGTSEIKVGDVVELIENFEDDTSNWKKFYGIVTQRTIENKPNNRTVKLNCYDYISALKNMDLDLVVEATSVKVTEEVLTPVYLDSPNENMAQLFNFVNDSIASAPAPLIRFRDKDRPTTHIDTQFDGFDIYYSTGQLRLGSPLNARDNYDVVATYYHYPKGTYIEDIIEEIIKLTDGYDNFLFGETSAANVVTNHLTTTYNAEEGSNTDTMTTEAVAETIIIETTLSVDAPYGSTIITLTDATGFPTSGDGTVSGDAFSWTGKSGNNLTGCTGLEAHISGDYVEYSASYAAGRVWYLKYDNVSTSLVAGNFTIGGGGTFSYFDKRYGRIILTSAIAITSIVTCDVNYTFSTLQATGVELNRITFRKREINNRYDAIKKVKEYLAPNYIIRTEGNNKIWGSYLTQNSTADYTINLPLGIEYMEDEDLYTRVYSYAKNSNPTNIMYSDDIDYSSASGIETSLAVGCDANATTITLVDGSGFTNTGFGIIDETDTFSWTSKSGNVLSGIPDSGSFRLGSYAAGTTVELSNAYQSFANNIELTYYGERGGSPDPDIDLPDDPNEPHPYVFRATDEELANQMIVNKITEPGAGGDNRTGFYAYSTPLSGLGKIMAGDDDADAPLVTIDGVPVDNKIHRDTYPVEVHTTIETGGEVTGGKKDQDYDMHTYYYYQIEFAHRGIYPGETIRVYNATGGLILLISPNGKNMDYERGIYIVTGNTKNSTIEGASTASYSVMYSDDKLEIDYEDAIFYIDKNLIPDTDQTIVKASFKYWAIALAERDIRAVVDGRRDTQTQVIFHSQPPSGFHLATIDLGQSYNIQAIDIIGGFFKPTWDLKFDVDFKIGLRYSTDNVTFSAISDETEDLRVTTGSSISLEEEDLGTGFEARYLRFILNDVQKINYKRGVWVVALSNISAYDNIIVESESTLISATTLNGALGGGETTVIVNSTSGFDSSGTAYLNAEGTSGNTDDAFTYSGITATTFTGCSGVQAQSDGVRIAQSLESDTTIYDDDGLLPQLGDRVYKLNKVSDRNLFTQTELDRVSKGFVKEFYKNHSKIRIDVLYAPYLRIGQTVNLVDDYNNINARYFLERIEDRSGFYSLVLGKYPA